MATQKCKPISFLFSPPLFGVVWTKDPGCEKIQIQSRQHCFSARRTFDNNLSVELEHVEFLGVRVASVWDHRHQGKPKK